MKISVYLYHFNSSHWNVLLKIAVAKLIRNKLVVIATNLLLILAVLCLALFLMECNFVSHFNFYQSYSVLCIHCSTNKIQSLDGIAEGF